MVLFRFFTFLCGTFGSEMCRQNDVLPERETETFNVFYDGFFCCNSGHHMQRNVYNRGGSEKLSHKEYEKSVGYML